MRADLREIFNQVRDIPYRIPLTSKETDKSCTGKHKQLKSLLEKEGLQVRWRVCSFKWSDINLPVEVSGKAHEDASTHAYLEVLNEKDWINVDATWDNSLSMILPVSEWDGKSNTSIAVSCLKLFSIKESAAIIADENVEVINKDLALNGEFYAAFNEWLENERRK